MTQKLWAADPHRYGPGKIHLVDPDKPEQTYCGKVMSAFPGRPIEAGLPTCRICCNAPLKRAEQAAAIAAYQQDFEERRLQEGIEWRRQHEAHLASPKWRELRALVLHRANGVCEGCGRARATQVHHLTYEHLGDEFLWELKAVCDGCHDRAHPQHHP